MTVTPTEQPEANLPPESAILEASPKPQTPEIEGYYYQAIGWLHGVIAQNEEEKKFYITLNDGTQFRLTAKPHILFAISQQVAKNPDVALWIRCYPQYRMLQQDLFFSVISYNVEKPEEARDKIFIFRGIWQFIPQSKRPVFSIYRNQVQEGEKIKNQHLPLIWKEEQPFRFRKDSDARPQFFQIEARLLTQRACFGFSKSLAEPARPPKRVRLPGQTPPPRAAGFKPKRDDTPPDKAQSHEELGSKPERTKPLPKPRKKAEADLAFPLATPASQTPEETTPTPEVTPASQPPVTKPQVAPPEMKEVSFPTPPLQSEEEILTPEVTPASQPPVTKPQVAPPEMKEVSFSTPPLQSEEEILTPEVTPKTSTARAKKPPSKSSKKGKSG